MLNLVDLSCYRILPQQYSTLPKILVSEITNEIEFYACTDTQSSVINYTSAKILEAVGVAHEPVFWGTDLKFYEDKFVSVTKFNLDQNWVYYADKEILDDLKNPNDLNFIFLMSGLMGGNILNDDAVGYVDNDNVLIKSFYYNMMFEIELAMYISNNDKAASIFDNVESIHDVISDTEKDWIIIEQLEDYLKKFISIKKSDWFDLLQFPQNSKFEKGKFWSIKKIMHAQKIIRKIYE